MKRANWLVHRATLHLISASAVILFASTSSAAIIHISPAGNDSSGDGTLGNPYFSLYKAENYVVPGDTIYVHEGTYVTDDPYWGVLDNMIGEPDGWITIKGAPDENKPVLHGIGLYITTRYKTIGTVIKYFRLENIIIRNSDLHAINIDDGGGSRRLYPTHHIEFIDIEIYGAGYAGIKMAGVDNFHISNIIYESPAAIEWPGLAFDIVGCHDGIIEDCQVTEIPYQSQLEPYYLSVGFMIKGGSRDIIVRDCYIESVYGACEIGQTTGPDYFRPPLGELDADGDIVNYEAKDITYCTNVIVNCSIPIEFANSIGGRFINNSIYCPVNYGDGDYQFTHFVKVRSFHTEMLGITIAPSQHGVVKNNVAVFGRAYGPNSPNQCLVWCQDAYNLFSTFIFENNMLFSLYDPIYSEPDWDAIFFADGMPVRNNNIYGLDPLYLNALAGNLTLSDGSPAIGAGQVIDDITNDFYDNLYNYDYPTIGAFEFDSEQPYVSRPRSLSITPDNR